MVAPPRWLPALTRKLGSSSPCPGGVVHSHSVISQCVLGTHTCQPSRREGEGRPESCPHGANLGEGDRQPVSSTGEGLLSCKRRTRGALRANTQRRRGGPHVVLESGGGGLGWGMMGAAGRARRPGCGGWGEHGCGRSVDWRQGQGCMECVQPRLSGSPSGLWVRSI